MKSVLLSAACAAALSLAAPARAQTSPLRLAELSFQLYAQGIAAKDPVLVLAAARLRQGLDLSAGEARIAGAARLPGKPVSVGLSGGARIAPEKAGDDEAGPATPLSAADMLDAAADLAAGDEALLGLIEDARAEGGRGVATGQVYSISEIRDGGTDTYDPLPFRGGEYAEVYVESRDGSDLNLFVYDDQGRLVCSDTDISAIAYCGWRPAANGAFTIEVKNRGQGGAGYALMTN